jgi:hypothetical protein
MPNLEQVRSQCECQVVMLQYAFYISSMVQIVHHCVTYHQDVLRSSCLSLPLKHSGEADIWTTRLFTHWTNCALEFKPQLIFRDYSSKSFSSRSAITTQPGWNLYKSELRRRFCSISKTLPIIFFKAFMNKLISLVNTVVFRNMVETQEKTQVNSGCDKKLVTPRNGHVSTDDRWY